MKSRSAILFTLMLVFALVVSGCGGGSKDSAAEAPVAEEAPLADAPLSEEAAPTEAPTEAAPAEEPAAEEVVAEEAAPAEASDTVAALDAFASNIPDGFLAVGSVDNVKAAMEAGALLVDVREASDYAAGHIPGSISIPIRSLAQNLDKIPTEQPVIIYCGSGLRAAQALVALQALGYDNVKSFPGSWKAWTTAEGEVSTEATEAQTVDVPEIDPALVAAADAFLSGMPEGFYGVGDVTKLDEAIDAGAFLVDVRETSEFAEGSIPGAINIPIRTLLQNLDQIPTDQPVIVYCASGHRASMANALLHMAGFDNVRIFFAGYGAWEAAHESSAEGGEAPAEVAAALDSDFDVVAANDAWLSAIPEGFYSVGNAEKFAEVIDASSPFLVDVREASEYAEGHVPGAVNIPIRTLAANLDKIPTDQPVIVYCGSGQRAGLALASLLMLGYDNVKSFPGGWAAWSAAELEVSTEPVVAESVTEVDVDPELLAVVDEFLTNIPEGFLSVGNAEKFAAAIDSGAAVLDVREESEYAEGHIPDAVNIPIRTLAENLDKVATDSPVVVYCASGHRAAMATAALQMMGYNNVRSFPAGYGAWEAAGGETE